MALMGRGVGWSFRRRGRRRLGAVQRAVTPLLAGAGFVVLVFAPGRHTALARWELAADSLPLLLAAVAWRWWRPTDEGLPDALRLRRRSRRIALRFASVPGVGSAVALALAVGAHGAGGHDAAQAALWLAVAAPVPVLVEAFLWRLAPSSLRQDVRIGGLVEEIQGLNARIAYSARLVFDPELGHLGRVVPQQHAPRPEAPGAPLAVVPDRVLAKRMVMQRLSFAEERWLVNASIRWDGSALLVTDIGGRTVAAPARRGARSLAGEPVELVWVIEESYGDPVREAFVLLLDSQDRCLLTMSGLGFDADELAALASTARLACSRYHLRLPATDRLGHALLPRMFPRRRGHIHVQLGLSAA
ncbi:hypothetical protein ABH931_006074 [Streptacidiphilus sp. MAP12-33]|uniref:hypothetical protein n=1 Tax=Streptacidiphilus sp. MAP12-33 TaxID=3156266 RepID=UPI0035150FCD